MPVPVQVLGLNRDTLLRLEHTRQQQRFEIDLDFEALGVNFDPDLELISTANTVDQQPVGTRDRLLSDNLIKVYPNPAEAWVQFLLSDSDITIERVLILDSTGRRLREISQPGRSLYVGDLPAGYYVLVFETNRGLSREWFCH
jgi:hypothetical protein